MEWLINNKEWVFSGIGVTVLVAIVGFFVKIKRSSRSSMTQNGGKNSKNIQVGGDLNYNANKEDEAKRG